MENFETELEEAQYFWSYRRPLNQNMFYSGDDKSGAWVYLVDENGNVFYAWDANEELLQQSEYSWKELGIKYNPNQEIYA